MLIQDKSGGENVFKTALMLKPTLLPVSLLRNRVLTSCLFLYQGEMTGVCVKRTKTCEVLAWCPVEDDRKVPEYADKLNYSRLCDTF